MVTYNMNAISSLFSIATILALLLSLHPKSCIGSRIILTDHPTNTQFIKTSCSSTTYPALCLSSLSPHATTIQSSRTQLANTSLSVALSATKSAVSAIDTISKSGGMSPRVAAAISDCTDTVADSVDRLKQSMQAMAHLGGSGFAFQLNSIQTWASAAITNDNTCTDGFADRGMDGKVKVAVVRVVGNAEKLTSNALAFINRLSA